MEYVPTRIVGPAVAEGRVAAVVAPTEEEEEEEEEKKEMMSKQTMIMRSFNWLSHSPNLKQNPARVVMEEQ